MTDKILVSENGVTREAVGAEKEYILDTQAQAALSKEEQKAEEAVKAQSKAAVLERLGITADEAKLLLG